MDRFTWGVAAGAVLLVVAALGSVILLQARTAPPDLSRPQDVVRAYYDALESGRPERAWDLLAPSAQAGTTRQEFIQRATSFRPGRDGRIAVERVDIEGSTAIVRLNQTYGAPSLFDPGGGSNSVTVRLERGTAEWRITVPPEPYFILRSQPPAPPATPAVVVATPLPTPTPAARP